MLEALLVVLIILWFLGYVHIGGITVPDIVLFNINGRPITLWELLILAVVSWVISILPSPFRQIAGVMLVLWILSTLGIIAFANLSSILVIAIIAGVIIYIIGGSGYRHHDVVE